MAPHPLKTWIFNLYTREYSVTTDVSAEGSEIQDRPKSLELKITSIKNGRHQGRHNECGCKPFQSKLGSSPISR